jgi:hypothetical protein
MNEVTTINSIVHEAWWMCLRLASAVELGSESLIADAERGGLMN